MIRLVLLPEYAISPFITGLNPEIGLTVKNHRPYSLPQAYQLVRNTEAQVNAQLRIAKSSMYTGGPSRNKGVTYRKEYQPKKKDHSVSFNRSNTRRLTPAEMSEKDRRASASFVMRSLFLVTNAMLQNNYTCWRCVMKKNKRRNMIQMPKRYLK